MKKYILILILLLLIAFSCDAKDQISKEKVKSRNNQADVDISPEAKVAIKNLSFQPRDLTVLAGTTVTWHNQDGIDHTITSDIGLFDSGVINPGKKFSFNFDAPGSYDYHCSIHPNMQGGIIVTGSEPAVVSTPIISEAVTSGSAGSVETSHQDKPSPSWSEEPLSGQLPSQGPITQDKALQLNINQTEVSQNHEGFIVAGPEPTAVSTPIISEAVTSGSAGSVKTSHQDKPFPSWGEESLSGQLPSQSPITQDKALQLNISQTEVSQNQLMQYSQYYQIPSKHPSQPLTAPTKYELSGQEPTMLYFGASQKEVPYSQYQTYAANLDMNSLWVRGASSWTQYAIVPQGASLSMIATSPSSGYGYLYEVYPDGTLDKKGYTFYPYNHIGFYADQVGQHLLFFVTNGQPSNVVAIDVAAYQPQSPSIYNYASVTISSDWLNGYDVYVDGNYKGTEGSYGYPPGMVTVTVPGNQYHTIAVQGNGFSFSGSKFFNTGWTYTLNV
ncbi:MAG: cupredoxin family copper-binding protein [Methanotrichaceae archaeon]|nr:cupredoxin family copper-binding protein [Methanotrichaceae archaeon]